MSPARSSADVSPTKRSAKGGEQPVSHQQANRETVESIVVAVILAFLFRGFIAEAFVIPTGSMAPTLMGSHKDIHCPECGYQYRAGASVENDEDGRRGERQVVSATTCPLCRFTLEVDPDDPDHWSFSGDRILVSKFSYQLADPKRWDVIVFKYPGNAKQNYIKRLIGLPNETIKIRHGDIYAKKPGEDYQIARKPDYRLRSLLHVVNDTRHIPAVFTEVGWPLRWKPQGTASGGWQVTEPGKTFVLDATALDATALDATALDATALDATGDQPSWLRYHHILPTFEDWEELLRGRLPAGAEQRVSEPITDFYAYNAFETYFSTPGAGAKAMGMHWVGDLAVECDVQVEESRGELLLDLVEGGVHYTCRLALADGTARLTINDGQGVFGEGETPGTAEARGSTSVRAPGRYALRFANVDNELRLWVNNRRIEFDQATVYRPQGEVEPRWSEQDPGDLLPVGVGGLGAKLQVQRLRVLRDVYYIAAKEGHFMADYEGAYERDVQEVLLNPASWATTDLFARRREVSFSLDSEQYFPLGDNSPFSKDARIWNDDRPIPNAVHRSLMTGEALLVYWPHSWYTPLRIYRPRRITDPFGPWDPVALTPNFSRMGLIR